MATEDARSDDARSDDARSDDARSDDARSDDARSDDARSDDARWEALFSDLAGQWEAAERAELAEAIADRSRLENARLLLHDRLRAQLGAELALDVLGAGQLRGKLVDTGPDWLQLRLPQGEALVAVAAVTAVAGLSGRSAPPGSEGVVAARLDLRYALRRIARDRLPVFLHLTDGQRRHGTLHRVGADFLELLEHPVDEPLARVERGVALTVPLAALGLVWASGGPDERA